MDAGRKADLKQLRKDLKTTKDPKARKLIEEAGAKIHKEQADGWIKAAREKMIKERQAGRQQNVRDIQHEMINRGNGHGEILSRSFGMNISKEDWDRIFKKD